LNQIDEKYSKNLFISFCSPDHSQTISYSDKTLESVKMFIISACVFILSLLFLFFRVKTERRNYLLSKIPSPKKYFLLHNLPTIIGIEPAELFKKFEQIFYELGDVVHLTLHPLDCGVVFVADYEVAKTLSNSQPDRTRSIIYEFLHGWIGSNGAFLGGGNQQREKMKLIKHGMTPKFHQKYIKIATFHLNEAVKELKAEQTNQIEFSSWISNVILDITFGKNLITYVKINKATFNCFKDVTMSFDLNSKKGKNSEYLHALEK
jgi:hypothetical protein